MRDELLHHYERELRYIRREATVFAERYPAIADLLQLEADRCNDPHVERLIEAFAMLAARVQLRLDDEFPEIAGAFLQSLCPPLVTPIPSLTVVQFQPDPDQSESTSGIDVPRGTQIHTRPAGGVSCRFRTSYPVTLWPIDVTGLDVIGLGAGGPGIPPGASAALRIRLQTRGAQSFAELPVESLAFYLDGDASVVYRLYEVLFRKPLGLLVRPSQAGAERGRPVPLTPDHLRPIGFGRDEGVLEFPQGAPLGHRLVQEYFAFPEKFLFAELTGLSGRVRAGLGHTLEVLVLLDELPLDLEGKLSPDNLKLGCTPAANLFRHDAEPIRLTHLRSEYPVIPDHRADKAYEVHSIETVEAYDPTSGTSQEFHALHAMGHRYAGEQGAFWQSSTRVNPGEDQGTTTYLTLIDRAARPLEEMPAQTLNVTALCSNGDLPSDLQLGDPRGDFQVEGRPGVARIRVLRKPTRTLRPPERRQGLWRLIGLLNVNHVSLTGPPLEGESDDDWLDPVALREVLGLLDFTGMSAARQRVAGVIGIRSRSVLRRVHAGGTGLFARGTEVRLHLDEGRFAGSGAYLLAAVIERFLGHLAPINGFTQLVATSQQREEVLKRWPPRAGERALV
ncbi:type VI secretion system baseplate subunit TssF [bacterium]|nr:type VI secretion system baseplate subunit TssF [bacterium]